MIYESGRSILAIIKQRRLARALLGIEVATWISSTWAILIFQSRIREPQLYDDYPVSGSGVVMSE
jgi:hypothetical protein